MITFQWKDGRTTLFAEIDKAFGGYGKLKPRIDSALESLQEHTWETIRRWPNRFGGTDDHGNHKLKVKGQVQIRILYMAEDEEATLLIAAQEVDDELRPATVRHNGGTRRRQVESPGGRERHREEVEEYPK